jgi:hypothetical protein
VRNNPTYESRVFSP